jgi:hypothetical protein
VGSATLIQVNVGDNDLVERLDTLRTVPRMTSLAINGIGQSPEVAAQAMAYQIRASDNSIRSFTMLYVPTNGFWSDIAGAAADKLGITTDIAKQAARIFAIVQADGTTVQINAFSRGGPITAQAVNYHLATGGGMLSNIRVECNGCANNKWVSAQIFERAGITANYNVNTFDIVGNVVGLNGFSNPFRVIGSILALPFVLWAPGPLNPHVYP